MKWYRIVDPIYNIKYKLAIGKDKDAAVKKFSKLIKRPLDVDHVQTSYAFVWPDDIDVLIYLPTVPRTAYELGVLAHEVFHCAVHALRRSEVSFSNGQANESFAYYISWLTEQILNKVK